MFHIERFLCKNIIDSVRSNQFTLSFQKIYSRKLFSPAKLGIDRYVQQRHEHEIQMQEKADHFKERMTQVCTPNSSEFVFTNDIKIMVYLAQADEDLELLQLMMEKYNNPNSHIRFNSFVAGPVIMRLYHHLGKPVEAMAVFEDEKTGSLFNQLSSYIILLDLLYKHECYEEVCKIFHKIIDKQLSRSSYNRDCVLLYFAACMKLNTPEKFEEAKNVWLELKKRTDRVWFKIKQFFVMLAINQNEPNIALEILSEMQIELAENISLYLLASAKAKRLQNALFHLRSCVLKDSSDLSQVFITQDTMEKLKPLFQDDEAFSKELNNIEEQCKVHNLIRNERLEELLTAEIPDTEEHRERRPNQYGDRRRSFR